jgi:hypothetical protein
MGTKNNPGKYDCFNKAEPDEPLFVLLGRDPQAAHLVSIWAKLRSGDKEAARAVFDHLLASLPAYPRPGTTDMDKAQEAMGCFLAMFEYRKGKVT